MRLFQVVGFMAGLLLACGFLRGSEFLSNWGVDAGVSWAVNKEAVPEWLGLINGSSVKILRERGSWGPNGEISPLMLERYSQIKNGGFDIVGFSGTPDTVVPVNKGNQLPEDLRAVYASGFKQGFAFAGLVSAWEMTGEPDVGYCKDLPDMLAAYNKAMYLGLHAGAAKAKSLERGAGSLELGAMSSQLTAHDPVVLMGALALHPGPWWERAVANGLLNYTDAYNFHFYGYAADLTSVIEAHRSALRELGAGSSELGAGSYELGARSSKLIASPPRRPAERGLFAGSKLQAPCSSFTAGPRTLPLWITECGVNATSPGDFFNEQRRAYQAQFTVETARQALEAPDVAVFMPFILVHKGDPHAMVVADNVYPFPAWEEYAKFTKDNPWPKRKLSEAAGKRANPVVVQWLPTAGTLSHKVAGCYRVRDSQALTGELRVYNFSERAVSGRWDDAAKSWKLGAVSRELGAESLALGAKSSELGGLITIPAGGCVAVPVRYQPKVGTGYFREWQTLRFLEETGRSSQVYFGVERVPAEGDFMREPVALRRLEGGGRLQVPAVNVQGIAQGPWRVFNGLEVRELGVKSLELGAKSSELGAQRWRFSMGAANSDPMAPTYAVAAVEGVPKGAQFLRVKLDRPMSNDAFLRVDLVDTDGQRFTIWENLGNVYGETSTEVWLGLADFHPYFWSKAVAGERRLRPEKVKEVHLRAYLGNGGAMDVGLEWATAGLPTKHTK
jgi:hypothetical protein